MFDVFVDQSYVQSYATQAESDVFVRQRAAVPKAYKHDPPPVIEVRPRKRFAVFRLQHGRPTFTASFDTEHEARTYIADRYHAQQAHLASIGHAMTETIDRIWHLQENDTALSNDAPVETPLVEIKAFDPNKYLPKVPSRARVDVRFNEEHFEFDSDTEASAFADAYAAHRGLSRTLIHVTVRKPVHVLQNGGFVASFDTVAQGHAFLKDLVQKQTEDQPEAAEALRARYTVTDTAAVPPPPEEPAPDVAPEITISTPSIPRAPDSGPGLQVDDEVIDQLLAEATAVTAEAAPAASETQATSEEAVADVGDRATENGEIVEADPGAAEQTQQALHDESTSPA